MLAHELWVAGLMKCLSLKRRRLDRREMARTTLPSYPAHLSLLQLPYEPLLEVLMNLEAEEILSIRLVSRCLYQTSETPELWRNLLRGLPATGREPVLNANTLPNVEELSLADAKRIVLRTLALARRWSGDGCNDGGGSVRGGLHKGMVCQSKVRLSHLPSNSAVAPVCILGGYTVVQAENKILCIDTLSKSKPGRVVAQYAHDVHDPRVKLYYNSPSSPYVLYFQLFGWTSENNVLHFVRLVIPDQPSSDPYFQFAHSYIVPAVWSIEAGAVDMNSNSVFLLVLEEHHHLELTLVAIFDLLDLTDTCVMLKSGLQFESSTCKEVMPVATLVGDRLVVSGKKNGLWTQISYYVADLRANASPVPLHPADEYYVYPSILRTVADFSFSTSAEKLIDAGEEIVSDWEFSLCGMAPMVDDALPSTCRLALLRSTNADASDRWRLIQLYTPSSRSKTHTAQHQLQPSFIELAKPVLSSDRQPLFDVSYNFAVWIEEVTEETSYRRRRFHRPGRVHSTRRLKVAMFPRPSGVQNDILRVATLRYSKASVLRRASRIFIRPSLASIFILTFDGTLYRIKFY